jgi:CRISPR-associated RAMP protein (TIGR02581 family)
MFETFENRLELSGILYTVTALRVSQGRSLEPIGADLPVVKDALGRPLIPGSSFKGAMRSRLESFLRGILGDDPKLVANPANEDEWSIPPKQMTEFKREIATLDPKPKEDRLHQFILDNTDRVSSLFAR